MNIIQDRAKSEVQISGAGCVCSAGSNVKECIEALYTDNYTEPYVPQHFQPGFEQHFPVFECQDYLAPELKDQENLFTSTLLVLQAVQEALQAAQLETEDLKNTRTGVCVGTTVGASLNILEFYQTWKKNIDPEIEPIYRYLRSNPALFLKQKFGLKGPCLTVTNACSSGTDALGIGRQWIEQGLCKRVLAGGTDELNELAYNGFIRLMNCSTEPCRPFDLNRQGLNLGEAGAMLVLESERVMQERDISSLGVLLGYATAADAYHLTAPHPEAAGLKMAFKQALDQAGLCAQDIALVNIHGTGTKANDQAEAFFLQNCLPGVPFFGTKGMTGHTLGAAGALEAIFTLYCLQKKRLPSTAGFEIPDPELGTAPAAKGQSIRGSRAISQSLAFGGNNSLIILGTG